MSQETQIGNLNGGISDEDSKLVDSILNDLNSHSDNQGTQQGHHQGGPGPQQGPQQGAPGPQQGPQQGQQMPRQELTPEQIRQIQMQRQIAMQQQQLMQQQQMAQQMAQQQGKPEEKKEMVQNNQDSDNFIDHIKNESKSIILVIFLSIILNLEQVDNLFKSQPSFFTTESGTLNMQAIFIKALIIGVIFYVVKSYLL